MVCLRKVSNPTPKKTTDEPSCCAFILGPQHSGLRVFWFAIVAGERERVKEMVIRQQEGIDGWGYNARIILSID